MGPVCGRGHAPVTYSVPRNATRSSISRGESSSPRGWRSRAKTSRSDRVRPSWKNASRRLTARNEGGLNSWLPTSSTSPTSTFWGVVYSGGSWQVAHFRALEDVACRARWRDRPHRTPTTAARAAQACRDTRSGRRPARRSASVPCMVVAIDLRTWSSSRSIEPVQVQGPVAATPSSEGTRFGAPYEPSPSVSLSRPLVWPSVWQLWQLIQPSCETRRWKKAARRGRRPSARAAGPGRSSRAAGRSPWRRPRSCHRASRRCRRIPRPG